MSTDGNAAAGSIELLRSLRAVRHYQDRPVPDAVLGDILRVARWTGSARNRQPWAFVVIKDRSMLQRLAGADGYAKHVGNAPLGIVIVLDGEIETQETYDEGRVSERMMLAALAHGVGSSIGWFTPDGQDTVKSLLNVPRDRTVRSVIAFGYAKETPTGGRPAVDQGRKPLATIVHNETFDPSN